MLVETTSSVPALSAANLPRDFPLL